MDTLIYDPEDDDDEDTYEDEQAPGGDAFEIDDPNEEPYP